jgi:hypothetical protein
MLLGDPSHELPFGKFPSSCSVGSRLRSRGQVVGRGGAEVGALLEFLFFDEFEHGLPGTHFMVTTNSVVSSARALPSW